MTHGFDKDYWESHWEQAPVAGHEPAPHPYLARETHDLVPGTALDAGCGEGAEAVWLAAAGWQVTAADISSEALARARARAAGHPAGDAITWVEADLGAWQPEQRFDLVTTHYAHPAIPQLRFYGRLAGWVAPGGTLLVVGHLRGHGHGPGDEHPPEEATADAAGITAVLDPSAWEVVTASEHERPVVRGDRTTVLHDVVVRARRRTRLDPG